MNGVSYFLQTILFLSLTKLIVADRRNINSSELFIKIPNELNLIYKARNETRSSFFPKNLGTLRRAVNQIADDLCKHHCQLVLSGLQNFTTWAVKFYDATGKFPEGLLAGSTYQLGNFDECLNINENEGNDSTSTTLRGQYCLAEIDIQVSPDYLNRNRTIWRRFREPEERHEESLNQLHWGICVPASCTPQHVQKTLATVLANAFAEVKLVLKVPRESCFKKEAAHVGSLDIIYAYIILSVISVVVLSTVFHATCLKNEEAMCKRVVPKVLISFSLILNLRKLLGPAHKDGMRLEYISGIKFISMAFIIAGHSIIFVSAGPTLGGHFLMEAVTRAENSIFVNNPLLVDTFLFLSGFLFCRMILHELDRKGSVNFLVLYIWRYVRLTPAYLAVIGFYVTWLTKLGSGPFWFRMQIERERCFASWWTNLLYINNYVNTDKICMFQSWYLAVDTQLFLLAPIFIYAPWKWGKLGVGLLITVVILSMIVPFVITLFGKLDPTLMIFAPELKDLPTNEYFKNFYIKTHMRAEGYCIGLLYGYILHRMQTANYRLPKKAVILGWLIAVASLLASMCSIVVFYGPRKRFTAIEAALYATLHRAFWSIGLGWILVACVTDNSGLVGKLLKYRAFVALSRLTYTAYLVNGLIILYNLSTTRSPQYLNYFNLTCTILSHIVLSFAGALLLSLIFEAPIMGLERILFKTKKKTPGETRETNVPTTLDRDD